MTISSDEQRVIDWLSNYSSKFFEVRDKLGINDCIGLGVFPEIQEGGSPACISKVFWINDEIYFAINDPDPEEHLRIRFYETPIIKLPSDEYERLIIPPKQKDPWLVSIFQKRHGSNSLDDRLLSCPDKVIIGLFAHELTEWMNSNTFIYTPKQILPIRAELVCKSMHYGYGDQIWIDVCAATHYKEEVIAKLNYGIECLETYDGETPKGFRPKRHIIEELKTRKRFVLKYT